MANLESIIQEDTTNINMSGSSVEPYAMSDSDRAKQTVSGELNKELAETPNIEPVNSLNIDADIPQVNPKEQKKIDARNEEIASQREKVAADVNQQMQEQKPTITWETAKPEQKIYINSQKGGSSFYEYYIPELDKIVHTNTTDEKEINRYIALSQAKTKEERDYIYASTYFTNQLITYAGPRNNWFITALKGVGNATVDVAKGAIQFFEANNANRRVKELEKLLDDISSIDINATTKNQLLDIPLVGRYAYFELPKEEQQEFLKIAYQKYLENVEKQLKSYDNIEFSNEKLKNIEMFRKRITDPLETLQNEDFETSANKKYEEWIQNPEVKKYISPSLLKSQEKLEKEFKDNPLIAKIKNDSKIELTKIAKMVEQYKKDVHLSYIPQVDNPYAYQVGNLGFSYAGSLVALATGHFELALSFAASQFGETMDKAIEAGLPLDVATSAANKTALYQYVTEKIQLNLFRTSFASLSKYISRGMLNTVAENSLQEGIQDFGTKALEQFYGVDSFTIEDYILDFCVNAGIGAVMSVPMGAVLHYKKAQYIKDFQRDSGLSEQNAIALADNVIRSGAQVLTTEEGRKAFFEGITELAKKAADEGVKQKSSSNVNEQNLRTTQNAAYDWLVQPLDKNMKEARIKDSKSAEDYTVKYLTEQVGMFEQEAKLLVPMFNRLYVELQATMGISKQQIAENLLPSVTNMFAIAGMNNYANEQDKTNYLKFEAGIQKQVRKNIGPVEHLTDKDFIDIAKDKMNGISEQEVSKKYNVTLDEERYNLLRNQMLLDKINFRSLKTTLNSFNIKNTELSNAIDRLLLLNPKSNEYIAQLNIVYNMINKSFGDKGIYGALVGNNNVGKTIKFFNTVFFRKPITGVDVHEIGHFFDIVYYSNQLSNMLGLPTTDFNLKIMNLYNKLGRAITGNKEFVYNPYDYENPEQIKVSEAFPNLLAQYVKNGEAKDADTKKLLDYVQSLYKYMNSNDVFFTTQQGNSKETDKAFKEMLKEWNKKQEDDIYYQSLEKLNALIERGDFTNDDIYKIVKDLPLNNGLKLAVYIEKGQNPVITMLQAITDIQNTRVDSKYRKAVKFNQDAEIKTKNLTIPSEHPNIPTEISDQVAKAQEEFEKSDGSKEAALEIYKKNGVYQDEAGNWGKIISDKDSSIDEKNLLDLVTHDIAGLREGKKVKLEEIMNHDELFNIAPDLKNTPVVIIHLPFDNSMGGLTPKGKEIIVNSSFIDLNVDKDGKKYISNINEIKNTLIHEIQHLLDYNAGLKAGSSPEIMYDKYIYKKYKSFIERYNLPSDFESLSDYVDRGYKNDNPSGRFSLAKHIIKEAISAYRAHIGEVRARFSEYNSSKDLNQLKEYLPTEGRDIGSDMIRDFSDIIVDDTIIAKRAVIPTKFLKSESQNETKEQTSKEKVLKDYNRHLPQKEQDEEFNLNMTVEEIMSNNLSKTFAVVSEVLKKDSPKLFAHSRRAMYKAMQDMVYYKHQLTELEKSIREMSNDDLYAWEKACLNRDIDTMYSLAGRYNFAPELVGMMKSLRELHQIVCSSFEGEQYNQLLGFLQNYWPRLVINHDGLASALAQKDRKFDSSNDTPETHNNKADKWMDEVQDWIENDLFYKKEKQGSPYFYKERKIEYVDDDLMPFYAKSTDALDNYLNKVQDILFRKYFFGSDYVKAIMNSGPKGKHINMNGIDYVIPNWKQRVKEMGFLTDDPKVNKQILDAIESVFFRGDTSSWNAIYRTATNIMTINSFFSALSNLGDLALTLYNYGFKNTMSAIKDVAVKDAPITSQDLGIVDLYEEFKADGTKLKKIFNWIMKWSGFQYLDRFTKEVNIQAALLSAKENLQKGGDAEAQLIDKCYMYMGGDEQSANALISNILNNNWTDPDVKLFAFNELSNQQPITKLEVPEFYNRYPQFRALYLYKTFAVKQLNFAYANIIDSIKKNPKEGFKKLVRFMAWLLAVGVTKDVIADMLKGKEINLTDSAMFSISSFFFLNEYNYYTFKSKGAAIGVFHLAMPPIPLLAEISSDVKKIYNGKLKNPMGMQVVKGVPVIGKPFYYWFGN